MQKEGCSDIEVGRKAQVTLFVIIALLIIGVVLLIMLWPTLRGSFVSVEPKQYVESCTKTAVKDAVQTVLKRGGSISPDNAVYFGGERIEYLCYTNEYYKTCVTQQPMLKQHVQSEIINTIKPKIEECLQGMKQAVEKDGKQVTYKRPDVTLDIVLESIIVDISLDMTVSSTEATAKYDKVRVNIKSNLYDLIMVAQSILNYEARYGDSDPLAYMFYYPDLKVEKYKQEEGTKIYIITHRETNEQFVFASRSLSWPPGYTASFEELAFGGENG